MRNDFKSPSKSKTVPTHDDDLPSKPKLVPTLDDCHFPSSKSIPTEDEHDSAAWENYPGVSCVINHVYISHQEQDVKEPLCSVSIYFTCFSNTIILMLFSITSST